MTKGNSINGAANGPNLSQQENNKNNGSRSLPAATTSLGISDQHIVHSSVDGRMVSLDEDEAQKLENIRTPHDHDVLCGRGGGTNNHVGNERFRDFVNTSKRKYLNSSKREKPLVSRKIVLSIRSLKPPGRFLQKDERTGLWSDIGDQKAREKTSQALREGAPDIRKEMGVIDPGGLVPADHKKKMLNMVGINGATANASLSPAALVRMSSNASTSSRGVGANPYHIGQTNVMSGPPSHMAGQHFSHQGRNPEQAYRDRTHLNNLNKMEAASTGAHTASHMTGHVPPPESQYLAMHLQQKILNGGSHNPYHSSHPHHLASPHSQQFPGNAGSAYYASNMHVQEEQQRYTGHPGHTDIMPRPMQVASRQSSTTSQYHYPTSAPASNNSSYSQHPAMPLRQSPVSHVDTFHSPPGSGQQYPPTHLQQQQQLQHGGVWGGSQGHMPSQGRSNGNPYYLSREIDYGRASVNGGRPLENVSSPLHQHAPCPSSNQDHCKDEIDKATTSRELSPSDGKKSMQSNSPKLCTLSSCPEEFQRRLVEDNLQTQNIAKGSVDLKRKRNQIDIAALYVDAGLLGIDPSKIAAKIDKGVFSEILSESCSNGESNRNAESDAGSIQVKKEPLNNAQDASDKLCQQESVDRAEPEVKSRTVAKLENSPKSEKENLSMSNLASSSCANDSDMSLNLLRKEILSKAKKFKGIEATLEAMGVS